MNSEKPVYHNRSMSRREFLELLEKGTAAVLIYGLVYGSSKAHKDTNKDLQVNDYEILTGLKRVLIKNRDYHVWKEYVNDFIRRFKDINDDLNYEIEILSDYISDDTDIKQFRDQMDEIYNDISLCDDEIRDAENLFNKDKVTKTEIQRYIIASEPLYDKGSPLLESYFNSIRSYLIAKTETLMSVYEDRIKSLKKDSDNVQLISFEPELRTKMDDLESDIAKEWLTRLEYLWFLLEFAPQLLPVEIYPVNFSILNKCQNSNEKIETMLDMFLTSQDAILKLD